MIIIDLWFLKTAKEETYTSLTLSPHQMELYLASAVHFLLKFIKKY